MPFLTEAPPVRSMSNTQAEATAEEALRVVGRILEAEGMPPPPRSNTATPSMWWPRPWPPRTARR